MTGTERGGRIYPPTSVRLWERVDKSGDCWIFTGPRTRNGYGFLKHGERNVRTHRLAFELEVGPIPTGMQVLHRCDNPPCVKPAHLFLGTHADNMADMARKGRQRGNPGEANGFARLTDAKVMEFRRRYAAGESTKALAAGSDLDPSTVWLAVTGRTWRHLPLPMEALDPEERAMIGGGLPG